MFRWLAIMLMSVMLIAVLVFAIGGWRVQTALANRLDSLTEELSSLHRAQEKLLDRKPIETPKIEGRAYLGDATQPAANAEVLIMNTSNVKLFRRLWTDGEGRFRSNSLPEGDYFVLAPLLTAEGRESMAILPGKNSLSYYLQSQPLYAYPGTQLDPLALDLRLNWGQVSVELVGPSPRQNGSGPPIHYRSQFVLATGYPPPPTLPTDPNGENVTKDWPLRGRTYNGPWSENNANLAFGGSVDEPLRTYSMLMAGEYHAGMGVVVFVDFDALDQDARNKSSWFQVQSQSHFGTVYNYPPPITREVTAFEVAGGKRTHLRITIPEGLEARARDLYTLEIKDYKAQADDVNAIHRALEPTPGTIEVITDQALLPDKNKQ